MKKIVGIIAAAAMATSVFAVDLNSMIQIDGDLMNYDGENFKALMAKEYDPAGDSDYLWKLSASGDKVGAEIWSWEINGSVTSKKVWFKPIDQLKVTIGNVYASSIANPQFGWWAKHELASYGYMFDVSLSSVSFTAMLAPGAGNYWLNPDSDNKFLFYSNAGWYERSGKIGKFWLDSKFNIGDAGQFQVFVASGATIGPHGFSNYQASPLAFGIAWNKMPYMQTGFYADVVASLGYKTNNWGGSDTDSELGFQGIDSQFGGQYVANGIKLQLTNIVQYRKMNQYASDGDFIYGFEFKGAYAFDGVEPYIQIIGYNVMKKALTVDLGASFNVGGASMYAALELPISFEDYNFTFSVPCEITFNL